MCFAMLRFFFSFTFTSSRCLVSTVHFFQSFTLCGRIHDSGSSRPASSYELLSTVVYLHSGTVRRGTSGLARLSHRTVLPRELKQ